MQQRHLVVLLLSLVLISRVFSAELLWSHAGPQLKLPAWLEQIDRAQLPSEALLPLQCTSSSPADVTVSNSSQPALWLRNRSGTLGWQHSNDPTTAHWFWQSAPRTEPLSALQISEYASAPAYAIGENHSLRVVWLHPQRAAYQAIDLSQPAKPQFLWQRTSNSTQSIGGFALGKVQTTSTSTAEVVLVTSGSQAVEPSLSVIELASGRLQAEFLLQQYASKVRLATHVKFGPLQASPALVDRDMDGQFEHIYIADLHGQIFRMTLQGLALQELTLVADLRELNVRLVHPLQAYRVRQPLLSDQKIPTEATTPALQSSPVSDILWFLAEGDTGQTLVVLPIPDEGSMPRTGRDLTLRSIGDVTDLPLPIAQGNGWYLHLPSRALTLPQVFAGVLYVPLETQPQTCHVAAWSDQLLALHLFQGTPVYTPNELTAAHQIVQMPTVVRRSNGDLVFWQSSDRRVLIPKLRGIQAECIFCSEILQFDKLVAPKRLATFHIESEVY